MEDAAAFLVDTSDNTILSHRSSALVGSTLESAASDPLMQSVAEKLDAGDDHFKRLSGGVRAG
jgi:methyl-accepting chemotaxis protein